LNIPSSKILYVTGKNFLSQKETSCHRKKLPVTGKNLLSHEETSIQGKKLHLTGKKLSVTASHEEVFKD
jgi:hypothetical protein